MRIYLGHFLQWDRLQQLGKGGIHLLYWLCASWHNWTVWLEKHSKTVRWPIEEQWNWWSGFPHASAIIQQIHMSCWYILPYDLWAQFCSDFLHLWCILKKKSIAISNPKICGQKMSWLSRTSWKKSVVYKYSNIFDVILMYQLTSISNQLEILIQYILP